MAKWERAPYPDHPDRCQSNAKTGQCLYMSMEGSKFCPRHGGNKAQEAAAKERVRMYKLTQYQDRVEYFRVNPAVKSLRSEIGILRMTLETVINKCRDENDLLMASHKIGDLVMKIDRLVLSAHKLESSMGELLDKMAALNLSNQIIEIITTAVEQHVKSALELIPEDIQDQVEHILGSDMVNQIGEGLTSAIQSLGEDPLAPSEI